MFGNLTGWHALILLVIVVLLFGATKLPALAKSVGQSAKIFKSEMKTGVVEDSSEASAPTAASTVSAYAPADAGPARS